MSGAERRPVPVLVVDDDDALRERLGQALRERGYEVATAATGAEALARAREARPSMAILDLRMPDLSGIEVLKRLRALDPAMRILVLTGYGSIANAVEATRLGAVGYLPKPADADEILAAFTPADAPAPAPAGTPSLARTEWEHIQRVLADCGGNVSEAARRLGIHRRSLQRKLQKYPPAR